MEVTGVEPVSIRIAMQVSTFIDQLLVFSSARNAVDQG